MFPLLAVTNGVDRTARVFKASGASAEIRNKLGLCVGPVDNADGDNADGDNADGDNADGDNADGDNADGDLADGDLADGDLADGDLADGDLADGDLADGDTRMPYRPLFLRTTYSNLSSCLVLQ